MDSHFLPGLRGAPSRARQVALASLLSLSFAAAVHAQDIEGKNIAGVDIKYNGTPNVDEAKLRTHISTHSGEAYHNEKVDGDIKSLYSSGLVEDVRVLAEPSGDTAVRLIFEVTTRGDLVAIGFTGNSKFKDNTLAAETKLKAGGSLSDEKIVEARQNIEKYYKGYGYPDVTVTHKIQASTDHPGGIELIFIIDEGAKNEIRRIRFEGNHVYDSKTLRKQMKVKEKGLFAWITHSGRFEVEELDKDVDSVLDYYHSHGYLRASSPGVRREPVKDGRVDLVIPIVEGEKYTVAGVGFGHMTVFKPEELYPGLSLVGGSAYSSAKMRDDIKMIRSYYGSRGYADATVVPDIKDAGPHQVQITYRITEGARLRVGRVNVGGNTKTQDKVIRRELPLKPDDYFNSVEMETAKSRLMGLQYFSDVQVTGTPSSRPGYRDVNVMVEEKRTGSVSAGVGFSSIDSIVGFVNLEQSNFDIFNPWAFTGGGQRFAMDLRLGSQRSDFSVSLTEPWLGGRKLSLTEELFYRDSQYYSNFYDQTNAGAAVSFRMPLGPKSYFKAEYRLEQIDIDLDSSVRGVSDASVLRGGPASLLLPEDGSYVRSAVGVNYVYDSRDAVIETRTGSKIDLGVNLAGLGGDVKTIGVSLQGQKYWNLWYDSILSINGELAFVDSVSGGRVPIFDRLFLGGGRTLRGFEFRDVGPRDQVTGETLGGGSLGYASFEYSVPVIDNVRVAAFYDLGFVNDNAWDPSPNDVYSDAGIGLRLRLPISPVPIALDYAIPVSSPDKVADKGGQFNFYLNYQY